MLTRYKQSQKKIAMGILSLTPEGQDLKRLCQLIERYDSMLEWQLYCWKEGEAIVGVVGIEITSDFYTVKHLAVLPSHRGENRAHMMLKKLQELMQQRQLQPSEETVIFLADWLELEKT